VLPENEIVQKVSLRFAKTGYARFFSHHDLMRLFSRAFRRVGLPVRKTSGFNPHLRMVFPHALGLGIASTCERLEVELADWIRPEKILELVSEAVVPVVQLLECEVLRPVKGGQVARVCEYEAVGWCNQDAVSAAVAEMLAADKLVFHRGKEGERSVDARPYLDRMELRGEVLWMRLLHAPKGAGRPDELCRLLAEKTGNRIEHIIIEKIKMELA